MQQLNGQLLTTWATGSYLEPCHVTLGLGNLSKLPSYSGTISASCNHLCHHWYLGQETVREVRTGIF